MHSDHGRAEGTTSYSVHFIYISKTSNNQRNINLHAGERTHHSTLSVPYLTVEVFGKESSSGTQKTIQTLWISSAWQDPETQGV